VSDGAVQETPICVLPTTPVTAVGTAGAVAAGVTDEEAVDAELVPTPFVAVTVKVYPVPFVKPVTLQVVVPVVLQVKLPGVDVTVYPVIADPPFEPGAVQDMAAWLLLPDIPDTPVGAPGADRPDAGVTLEEATDAEPCPAAFVAFTVKV